jgi:hypothetical protein
MSTQDQSTAERTVDSLKGLDTETEDQLFSDRQLAWALPGAWVLMYVFIVTTQWYPGFIWLNWPLQIVYAYVFFIRSAP